MAEFSNFVITNDGQALMARLMANQTTCNFTQIKTSSTVYAQEQLEELSELTNIEQSCDVSTIEVQNPSAIRITGAVNNTLLTEGYMVNTIGLYATDLDTGNDILYAVSRAITAGYMPPYNNVTSSGILFDFIVTVGNTDNVTIIINPAAVATQADLTIIHADIDAIQGSIETIQNDISTIQEDVETIQDDVSDLAGYVGYIEDDIYGVEIDFVNRTFTRLAGAIGKNAGSDFDDVQAFGGRYRCNLTDGGVEVAKRGEAAYTETGKLTQAVTVGGTTYPVGTLVQVMVKQPRFYYKVVPLAVEKVVGGKGYKMRKGRYYVSVTPKTGFKLHPAFKKNGKELNHIYLSAFEGSLYDVSAGAYILNDAQIADFNVTSGDRLSSIANAKPISGLTQDLNRRKCGILAENRGNGWSQQYTATASCTQLLIAIEYAGMNSQSLIGLGVVNKASGVGNESELTGATSSLGNASGRAAGTDGFTSVSYRGEENVWSNIWKFNDGANIFCDPTNGIHDLYVADNGFAESKNTSPYVNAGITLAMTNGYISAMAYNEEFDWLFFPAEVLGDSALPVGDYFYQSYETAGYKMAILGGDWSNGVLAGAFCWVVLNAPANRSRNVGGRLVYAPPAA